MFIVLRRLLCVYGNSVTMPAECPNCQHHRASFEHRLRQWTSLNETVRLCSMASSYRSPDGQSIRPIIHPLINFVLRIRQRFRQGNGSLYRFPNLVCSGQLGESQNIRKFRSPLESQESPNAKSRSEKTAQKRSLSRKPDS